MAELEKPVAVFMSDVLTLVRQVQTTISPFMGFIGALAGAIAGTLLTRYRAQRKLTQRDSLDRLHVSLSLLGGGRLKIRTILERPLSHVVPNIVVSSRIMAAARRATADDPILDLSADDARFALNCIINATAEHFCRGFVREDINASPATEYTMFLTCEAMSEVSQRKIRALLVKSAHLQKFPYAEALPELEHEWHADRINTIRSAAGLRAKRPELFARIEISV